MDRNISISFTTGALAKAVAVFAIAWALWYLRDIVLVVLTAVVISSALEPGIRALVRRKVPRLIAVLLLFLVILGGFLGVFYFFLPSLLSDVAVFVASLPTYLDAFGRVGAFDDYSRILGLDAPTELSSADILSGVRSYFDFGAIFGNAFSAASSVFGGVLSLVLIIVFSFYFAVVETGVDDFLRIATPVRYRSYVLDLWRRSQHKIGLWMQGQLLLGLIMGVLVYLSLSILGIPHALILAVIAAMFELIPVFGPTLAAAPAVVISFVDGGAGLGFLVVALYIILQQFENHLIYPLVVTKVIGVPPLLVILALIIGAKLAGFFGIILSVPVAAAVQEFVKDIGAARTFVEEGSSGT